MHFNANVPLGVRGGKVHTFHGVGGLGVCPSNVHDLAFGHIEGHPLLVGPVHQVVEALLEGCNVTLAFDYISTFCIISTPGVPISSTLNERGFYDRLGC